MVEEPLRGASKAVRDAAEAAEEQEENPHLAEELFEVSESMENLTDTERSPDESRVNKHRETIRELHGKVMNEDARVHLEKALGELSSLYEPASTGTIHD